MSGFWGGNSSTTNPDSPNYIPGGGAPKNLTKNIGYGQPYTDKDGNVDLTQINLPFFQQDRQQFNDLLRGQSPFASQDWTGLISQLQARASGDPTQSLAYQNYNIANQQAVNTIGSLARGSGSAGAAQTAIEQAGRLGQGQAAGLALATTQEQQANQALLANALSSRDQINQNAFTGLLNGRLQLDQGQLDALKSDQGYRLGNLNANNAANANTAAAVGSTLAVLAAIANKDPNAQKKFTQGTTPVLQP